MRLLQQSKKSDISSNLSFHSSHISLYKNEGTITFIEKKPGKKSVRLS